MTAVLLFFCVVVLGPNLGSHGLTQAATLESLEGHELPSQFSQDGNSKPKASSPAQQAVDALLEHEPRHWRNAYLSSGAVVRLECDALNFLPIQDIATDIWQTRTVAKGKLEMDVQVRHDWVDALRTLNGVNESSFTVVHPDLLATIAQQAAARRGDWQPSPHEGPRPPSIDSFFDEFRPQDEVEAWMQQLADRNPSFVRFVSTIGQSVEGRPIPALVIGGTDAPSGPAIYFQATVHARYEPVHSLRCSYEHTWRSVEGHSSFAHYGLLHTISVDREWITTSTILYVAAAMAESTDPRIRALVSAVTFYFVPTVNPDGYIYSWTGPINRMLRKSETRLKSVVAATLCNLPYVCVDLHWPRYSLWVLFAVDRAPDPLGIGGLCDGVDLNRNYGTRQCFACASTKEPAQLRMFLLPLRLLVGSQIEDDLA